MDIKEKKKRGRGEDKKKKKLLVLVVDNFGRFVWFLQKKKKERLYFCTPTLKEMKCSKTGEGGRALRLDMF